jgi:hypothetical protein
MREITGWRLLLLHVPWVLGFAIVMAVIGPFGSYLSMTFPVRLFFFTSTALVFWLQVLLYAHLLRTFEPTSQWPGRGPDGGPPASWPRCPAPAAIMVLVGWLVPADSARLRARDSRRECVPGHGRLGAGRPFHRASPARRRRQRAGPNRGDSRGARGGCRGNRRTPLPQTSSRRVPPALGRDLLALEMEDHYLRIHTTRSAAISFC